MRYLPDKESDGDFRFKRYRCDLGFFGGTSLRTINVSEVRYYDYISISTEVNFCDNIKLDVSAVTVAAKTSLKRDNDDVSVH